MADKPKDELTEAGHLPMPLILCKTTRPHSLTPKHVRARIEKGQSEYLPMPLFLCKTSPPDSAIASRSILSVRAVMAAIKNWFR